MNAYNLRTILRRRNLVPLTTFFLLSLIVLFGFIASRAHPRQDGTADSAQNERKFENGIPAHVPLKVKLKREKSFKDLETKGWARELEVEVKNTGSKSIQYLYVIFLLPDSLLEDGIALGFRVIYAKSAKVDDARGAKAGRWAWDVFLASAP